VVFFVYSNPSGAQHGLIVSLVDMSVDNAGVTFTMAWSGNTTVLIGATAQSTFDGQANTNAIIAQTGGGSTANKAATICDAYTITDGTGTYNDWYLPAKDELYALWKAFSAANTAATTVFITTDFNLIINKSGVAGATGFAATTYWSSSEGDPNEAWLQHFGSGSQNIVDKSSGFRVRCVRAF
jgi:hypothetical protein